MRLKAKSIEGRGDPASRGLSSDDENDGLESYGRRHATVTFDTYTCPNPRSFEHRRGSQFGLDSDRTLSSIHLDPFALGASSIAYQPEYRLLFNHCKRQVSSLSASASFHFIFNSNARKAALHMDFYDLSRHLGTEVDYDADRQIPQSCLLWRLSIVHSPSTLGRPVSDNVLLSKKASQMLRCLGPFSLPHLLIKIVLRVGNRAKRL